MTNFNKFLSKREVLKTIITSSGQKYQTYFILLLILVVFFILVPMWKAGRQGLLLWLVLVITLIFIFAKQELNKNNIYLLTNQRLIHLKNVSNNNAQQIGFIKLKNIDQIIKKRNTLCLLIDSKKYYLFNIQKADKVYKYIKSYIKT